MSSQNWPTFFCDIVFIYRPFQLLVAFADEGRFLAGVTQAHVLVDGRALDGPGQVAERTAVRVIE